MDLTLTSSNNSLYDGAAVIKGAITKQPIQVVLLDRSAIISAVQANVISNGCWRIRPSTGR
jgi:hypothetical protein